MGVTDTQRGVFGSRLAKQPEPAPRSGEMMRTKCLWAAVVLAALCVAFCSAMTSRGAGVERPRERVRPAPQVNPNAVVWRTPQPPRSPQAGDAWTNPKDGMEMVYVASGEFLLGTSEAQLGAWLREHPNDTREVLR